MENTLLPGDRVIVSKIHYGAKIKFKLSIASSSYIDTRLPGFSSVKRGDIIVFNLGSPNNSPLIKRCIGLPGDLVQIKNTELYVNKRIDASNNILFDYIFRSKNTNPVNALLNLSAIDSSRRSYNEKKGLYILTLSEQMANSFIRKGAKSLHKINKEPGNTSSIFPYDKIKKWSRDNYGPIRIPSKGAKINLTPSNILMYAKYIKEEGNDIILGTQKIQINNIITSSYKFKRNYYFVLGDNRHHSVDSRWLGFIPEDSIIGKALFIPYSQNLITKDINFNRSFKRLR